jgi:hypothetical protein
MNARTAATLACLLGLAAAADASDFTVTSRYSELLFDGNGVGAGAPDRQLVEEDPAVTFDETWAGESWYVEPGGATNTTIYLLSQYSAIEPAKITARLAQWAIVGTDHGSPVVFQHDRFIVHFTVAAPTPVRLTGALGPAGSGGTWSRVMLAQGAVSIFNTDFSHTFPYTTELQPGADYTLQVEVHGAAFFDATTESSAEAVLSVRSDSDLDGLFDDADNCTLVANPDQRDTNGDGYGNACDPDLNDDGTVDFVDLGLFKSVFFTTDADADLDGDGVVNFIDIGIAKGWFFLPPGPSGLVE